MSRLRYGFACVSLISSGFVINACSGEPGTGGLAGDGATGGTGSLGENETGTDDAAAAAMSPARGTGITRIQVTVQNENARASSGRAFTRNRRVNSVLRNHGVTSYRQAYPYSELQQLLDVYQLTCSGCDARALQADLRATHAYSKVRTLGQPIALDKGNDGGYDPADWMWVAHAKDWMWSLVATDADLAWNMTQGDPNVLIAVIDAGFDVTHPELAAKMEPYDPYTGQPLPYHDHGTMTASVAAAETAEPGTTPDAMMPSVGFNSDLAGFAWGDTAAAHYAALAMDADVVSISWANDCDPIYGGNDHLAIQEILDSGTTIVASAGNGPHHCDGKDLFPFSAMYDDRVIIVTSTDDQDRHFNGEGTHSHYENVDLAAPGYGVMVASSESSWDYYGDANGTSFATPFVSGTVALMKSQNACLRPLHVEEILKNSTDPIADAASYPNGVGTGRVNVNRAVALTQASDYACPQGGSWDTANCHIGTPPDGTTAFIWGGNYYYTAVNGDECPYPGSWYDGANCFVQPVPEDVEPFVYDNKWYYGSCADGGWTKWKNRDRPNGSGDYETLDAFSGVCSDPVAVQCRATDHTYWTQTGDVDVSCSRDRGLVCRNDDQPDGTCEDYEVRFYCP